MFLLLLIAIIGFCISLYSFFIEQQLKKDATYKPVCDISDRASCTKALTSQYSTTFGISNTIMGMIFYAVFGIATLLHWYTVTFLLAVAALIMSIWFAYLLYYKLRLLCLVCTSIYVVNIGLFLVSFYKKFGV